MVIVFLPFGASGQLTHTERTGAFTQFRHPLCCPCALCVLACALAKRFDRYVLWLGVVILAEALVMIAK